MTASTDSPDFITTLDALLLEQIALEGKLEAQVNAFERRIADITGNHYERTGIRIFGPCENAIVDQYMERVEALAVRHFSVPDGPFVVDIYSRPKVGAGNLYQQEPGSEQVTCLLKNVMPSAYWRQLKQRVDPNAQRNKQAREAAITLGKLVGLLDPWCRPSELTRSQKFVAPKEARGCFEFKMPGLHIEEGYRSRRLTCGSQSFALASALSLALSSAGYEGAAIGSRLDAALNTLDRSDFVSRHRVDLGDGAHLITYLSGTKLFLPLAVGEIINLFIGENIGQELQPALAA